MLDRLPEEVAQLIFRLVAENTGKDKKEILSLTRLCKKLRSSVLAAAYRNLDLTAEYVPRDEFESPYTIPLLGPCQFDALCDILEKNVGDIVTKLTAMVGGLCEFTFDWNYACRRQMRLFNACKLLKQLHLVVIGPCTTELADAIRCLKLHTLWIDRVAYALPPDGQLHRILASQAATLEDYEQDCNVLCSSQEMPFLAQIRHLDLNCSNTAETLRIARQLLPQVNRETIHTLHLWQLSDTEIVITALQLLGPSLVVLKVGMLLQHRAPSTAIGDSISQLLANCLKLEELLVYRCEWFTGDHLEALQNVRSLDLWTVPGLNPTIVAQCLNNKEWLPNLRYFRVTWRPRTSEERMMLESHSRAIAAARESRQLNHKFAIL